jgi:subtilisin family serine protease
MANLTKDGDDFDPTNMESLLVARPLLEMMALQQKQQADPEAFSAAEMLPPAIPVVIDLNVKFDRGLEQAKENVIALLKEHGVTASPNAQEKLNARKTRLSSQYVFATLLPDTIRALAAYMRGEKASADEKKRKSRGQREIFAIWPDFKLESHIHRTVATIKVDAAQRSFRAAGDGIVWAVVDSGIDGDHWHFKRHRNLDLSGVDNAIRHMDFTQDWGDPDTMDEAARRRAIAAEEKAALSDAYGHGSHVAGIIAGEYVTDPSDGWSGAGSAPKSNLAFRNEAFVYYKRRTAEDDVEFASSRRSHLAGMSPRTKLVSFKVLDEFGAGEVSNVIAALAQIQAINEYGRYLRIHGVNLSVGYPFNPEWFACGKSPLCVEVDRLVKSGVVVVVSAGNSGYGTKQTLMTRKVRAGMLMTINDPGNARNAITVGATHGEKPHEYGPSYFSSKGPTGDGRLKPDLLAPGERIISCGAGAQADDKGRPQDQKRLYVDQSGTSMAAPHVSGAIAAFLSIRREFIGQPEKVKDIFMQSATDLGRDRNMQGAGLVDLMRAIQSV